MQGTSRRCPATFPSISRCAYQGRKACTQCGPRRLGPGGIQNRPRRPSAPTRGPGAAAQLCCSGPVALPGFAIGDLARWPGLPGGAAWAKGLGSGPRAPSKRARAAEPLLDDGGPSAPLPPVDAIAGAPPSPFLRAKPGLGFSRSSVYRLPNSPRAPWLAPLLAFGPIPWRPSFSRLPSPHSHSADLSPRLGDPGTYKPGTASR